MWYSLQLIHFCTDLLFSERDADIAALVSDIVTLAQFEAGGINPALELQGL